MLTQERLKYLLHYDPDTGEWHWVNPQSYNVFVGQSAGTISFHGYRIITIGGAKLRAARLAWLYMTGEWPENEIDHIDRCKLNDRWENLRDASRSENALNRDMQYNNTSGARGVHWDVNKGKWTVQVKMNGVNHFIGRFDYLDEAVAARDSAATRIQGDSAILNEETET